jgi:hypothetical protein
VEDPDLGEPDTTLLDFQTVTFQDAICFSQQSSGPPYSRNGSGGDGIVINIFLPEPNNSEGNVDLTQITTVTTSPYSLTVTYEDVAPTE